MNRNPFQPERYEDETQIEYRERQALSRSLVKRTFPVLGGATDERREKRRVTRILGRRQHRRQFLRAYALRRSAALATWSTHAGV